jgi:hypothetical protein
VGRARIGLCTGSPVVGVSSELARMGDGSGGLDRACAAGERGMGDEDDACTGRERARGRVVMHTAENSPAAVFVGVVSGGPTSAGEAQWCKGVSGFCGSAINAIGLGGGACTSVCRALG